MGRNTKMHEYTPLNSKITLAVVVCFCREEGDVQSWERSLRPLLEK